VHYNASYFLQMLNEHGGVQTARILLQKPVSDGYTAMWNKGRLDLTVEALIHDNPKWHRLFDKKELDMCTDRLQQFGYLPVHPKV
jgi:hypothetical protein